MKVTYNTSSALTIICACSLADRHKPIDCLPCQLQNLINPTELVDSRRTIEQLKSLNPHELHVSWCPVIRFKP